MPSCSAASDPRTTERVASLAALRKRPRIMVPPRVWSRPGSAGAAAAPAGSGGVVDEAPADDGAAGGGEQGGGGGDGDAAGLVGVDAVAAAHGGVQRAH